MKALAVAAVSAAVFGATAFAQSNRDPVDIVVTGERLREALRSFVGEIAAAPADENQLARWDRRICPGVVGLTSRAQAQFIVDRIARRASAVGLEAGAPGCRANVLIFVTPDPDRLAQTIVREFGPMVGANHGFNTSTMADVDLAAFQHSERPVRWWHVNRMFSADGFAVHDPHPEMDPTAAIPTVHPAQVRVNAPSRLRRTTRQDFTNAIVIVDAHQAADHSVAALGDYLAMSTLAQLDASADVSSYPTILNLFGTGDSPSSMTDWDVAYLDGLYHATREARSSRQQEGEIAHRMLGGLSANPASRP